MADDPTQTSNSNGELPKPKSLREVAEEAYDELIAGDDEATDEPETGQEAQPRDTKGRFVARESGEPGEADDGPTDAPAPPESPSEATPAQPAPVAGRSTEPPQHWPAEDREMFAKLPQEGRDFLLRRHNDMERFVTQKTTAAAQAVEFVNAVAPAFQDPAIAGSLQQAGVSPVEAVHQLLGFHKRFLTDPAGLIRDLIAHAKLDPAALAPSRPGPTDLPPEMAKDPAMKFIAETIGKSQQRVLAVEQRLEQTQRENEEQRREELRRQTRAFVDYQAGEKDAQGNPLRPHFDTVINEIITLYKADRNRNLDEAYQEALWMNPTTRAMLVNADRATAQQAASNERARQAVKSNLKGRSVAASAPAQAGNKSLRETLEEAADELGI